MDVECNSVLQWGVIFLVRYQNLELVLVIAFELSLIATMCDSSAVGGVMGYLKSGSQKSLVAGGISASLLYVVYTQLPSRPTFASSLGLGDALPPLFCNSNKSPKNFILGSALVILLVENGCIPRLLEDSVKDC